MARTYHPHPLFSNFLFTNLFSMKFLYFFIISSLFPYFNFFVSIFIQSYANNKLHVSRYSILHKACNSAGLKIVPLLASSTLIFIFDLSDFLYLFLFLILLSKDLYSILYKSLCFLRKESSIKNKIILSFRKPFLSFYICLLLI